MLLKTPLRTTRREGLTMYSSKSCGKCGGAVSESATVGGSCPHCGARWGGLNTRYVGGVGGGSYGGRSYGGGSSYGGSYGSGSYGGSSSGSSGSSSVSIPSMRSVTKASVAGLRELLAFRMRNGPALAAVFLLAKVAPLLIVAALGAFSINVPNWLSQSVTMANLLRECLFEASFVAGLLVTLRLIGEKAGVVRFAIVFTLVAGALDAGAQFALNRDLRAVISPYWLAGPFLSAFSLAVALDVAKARFAGLFAGILAPQIVWNIYWVTYGVVRYSSAVQPGEFAMVVFGEVIRTTLLVWVFRAGRAIVLRYRG